MSAPLLLRGSRPSLMLRSSPNAPRYNLKGQFWLEFNNYLRSALTLRRVSSQPLAFGWSLETNRVSRSGFNLHRTCPLLRC